MHEQHAVGLPQYASRGATAYALEKAAMYKHMSEECRSLAESVHKDLCNGEGDDEVTDVRRVYLPTLMGMSVDTLDHSLVGGIKYLLVLANGTLTVYIQLTSAEGGEGRGGELGGNTAEIVAAHSLQLVPVLSRVSKLVGVETQD